MKKILIIIPTYNEVTNIDVVILAIERLAHRIRKYNFNILIVDDRSPDGTAKRVQSLQKQFDNIKLLSGQKSGLGAAYLRAFRYALKHSNDDVFIMMDADMSHSPSDIPALLKAIDSGADYVIGSRYVTGGTIPGSWPFMRIVVSRVANFTARILTGMPAYVADTTGGFKAIRRTAFEKINLDEIKVAGYVFQLSLLHAFLMNGLVVQEVPIAFTDRQRGTSKLRIRDILEFLYRAYKLNPNAPIQKFARFGIVGGCGSIINIGILTILVKFAHLNVFIAVVIAIETSIIFNFYLNHIYTFKGYGAYAKQIRNEPFSQVIWKIGKYNFGAIGGVSTSPPTEHPVQYSRRFA